MTHQAVKADSSRIPPQLDVELSLATIAQATDRIADTLDKLVETTNALADATYAIQTNGIEEELKEMTKKLPANWDALETIGNSLWLLLKEFQNRVDRREK